MYKKFNVLRRENTKIGLVLNYNKLKIKGAHISRTYGNKT